MIRTSLYLPETLHQRLLVAAQRRSLSISRIVRTLLDKTLAVEESNRLEGMFAAWEEVRGIGKEPITDASTTIDEFLYGEKGAWKGDSGDNGLWTARGSERVDDR